MSVFSSEKIDRLGSRLASLVSSASEKVKEAAERTLAKDTPLERNLKEAVSDKNWGCATSVLSEVSRASHSYNEFVAISKTMWEAIAEPPKRWRRIFKGLTMLEYLLKNGNEKFAEQARDKSYVLRMLQNFSWAEEGRDKGAGIREKAELCCTLIFDAAELKQARDSAVKNRDRYIAISSSSSVAYRGNSSGQFAPLATRNSSIHRSSSIRSVVYDPHKGDSGKGEGRPNKTEASLPSRNHKDRAGPSRVICSSNGKQRSRKGDVQAPNTTSEYSASGSAATLMECSDLLGLDSHPATASKLGGFDDTFASGSVWGEYKAATCPKESSFSAKLESAGIVQPLAPPSSTVSAGWCEDDLFGRFQAAPTSTGVGCLDVVSAAFELDSAKETTRTAPGQPAGDPLEGLDFSLGVLNLNRNDKCTDTPLLCTGLSLQPQVDNQRGLGGATPIQQPLQWNDPFTFSTSPPKQQLQGLGAQPLNLTSGSALPQQKPMAWQQLNMSSPFPISNTSQKSTLNRGYAEKMPPIF